MPTATTLFIIIGVIIVLLIILGVVYYYYSKKQASANAAPQTIVTSPNSVSVISTPQSAPSPQSPYPAGLTEGEVVRCATTGSIYQLVNGMKQWYPSPAVYAAYGSPQYTDVDCNILSSISSGYDFSAPQTATVNIQGTPIPAVPLVGQESPTVQPRTDLLNRIPHFG